jgi:hypothetical protein
LNDILPGRANLSGVAEEIYIKNRKAFEAFADIGSQEQVEGIVQSTVKELGDLNVVSLRPALPAVPEALMFLNNTVANARIFIDIVEATDKNWAHYDGRFQ